MTSARVAAFIGIGSNLGDARANVEQAFRDLDTIRNTTLKTRSAVFLTAPIDADGGDYINAVAQLETSLSPHELLHELQALEKAAGRDRPYVNAPRTLDLDLLLYGKERISSETLTVPHPRMLQRAFVLIPLLQIDPFIAIPGKGPAHTFVPDIADQVIRKI